MPMETPTMSAGATPSGRLTRIHCAPVSGGCRVQNRPVPDTARHALVAVVTGADQIGCVRAQHPSATGGFGRIFGRCRAIRPAAERSVLADRADAIHVNVQAQDRECAVIADGSGLESCGAAAPAADLGRDVFGRESAGSVRGGENLFDAGAHVARQARRGARRGGSVAELSRLIGSPTRDGAGGEQRAAVLRADGHEGGRRAEPGHRHRAATVSRQAVAELPLAARPPTDDAAGFGHRASVFRTRRDLCRQPVKGNVEWFTSAPEAHRRTDLSQRDCRALLALG